CTRDQSPHGLDSW
nr:immunoglobulin heavy chain junction region [Macaca mulatta]